MVLEIFLYVVLALIIGLMAKIISLGRKIAREQNKGYLNKKRRRHHRIYASTLVGVVVLSVGFIEKMVRSYDGVLKKDMLFHIHITTAITCTILLIITFFLNGERSWAHKIHKWFAYSCIVFFIPMVITAAFIIPRLKKPPQKTKHITTLRRRLFL